MATTPPPPKNKLRSAAITLLVLSAFALLSYFWLYPYYLITKASLYEPPEGVACLTVLTPAKHSKSGARYTFPNSCLPEGWEPVKK